MEVCRLCLDLLHDNNFCHLEGPHKEMIQLVTPELNLEISPNPTACKGCLDSLDKLYKFKKKFFEIERDIKEKLNNRPNNLGLREIVKGVSNGDAALTDKAKDRLCRTCLECIECESFTVLTPSNPDAYLDSMLIMCLPELDLKLSKDPVMCEKCFNNLQELHHLKSTSLDVEEKINNYCALQGTNSHSQINLHNVLQSSVNTKSQYSNLVFVKTEEIDDDNVDNATKEIVMPESKNGTESPMVKLEDMDVKVEGADEEDKCNSEFKDEKQIKIEEIMKEVKKNHKDQLHFSCSQCSFVMNNKRHYIMHMLTTHTTFNDEARLMHFCHLCAYKTMYKDTMKKHIVNYHMEKEKYTCPHCSFTSLYHTNMKRHISKHEDLQELSCNLCDFKTSYKFSLERHEIKIHGNQCTICPFRNANRNSVLKHMREVHDVYKIHACNKCNFKTFYLLTLKRHRAREHKGMKTNYGVAPKSSREKMSLEEEEEYKNLFS